MHATATAPNPNPRPAVPPSVAPNFVKVRDGRLDFWRGLCLLDMVLVHSIMLGNLPCAPWAWMWGAEYTRFAAGGFVFIAGLSVGAIYLPRLLKPGGRWTTYKRVWQRAGYVLLVHYASTLVWPLYWALRVDAPPPSVGPMLRDVLLLRYGHDLLPFYVVMLGLTPLMLAWMGRPGRMGWRGWTLAALSVRIFAFGTEYPDAIRLPLQETFTLTLWQLFFVAGLLVGANLKRYDALPPVAKRAFTTFFCGGTLLLSVLAYGKFFGLTLPVRPEFTKWPMTGWEAARYLFISCAIFTASDLAWRWVGRWRLTTFTERLGRKSLAVFVTHMFFVWNLTSWAKAHPIPHNGSFVYVLAAMLLTWGVAWALERIDGVTWTWGARAVRPARWAIPLTVGLTVAGLLIVGGVDYDEPQPAAANTAAVEARDPAINGPALVPASRPAAPVDRPADRPPA